MLEKKNTKYISTIGQKGSKLGIRSLVFRTNRSFFKSKRAIHFKKRVNCFFHCFKKNGKSESLPSLFLKERQERQERQEQKSDKSDKGEFPTLNLLNYCN